MFNQITRAFSILLFVAVLTFVFSCNNSENLQPKNNDELTKEDVIEFLKEKAAAEEKNSPHQRVEVIDGKKAADYYREWQQSTQRSSTPNTCEDTPNCPKRTVTGTYFFNTGCNIAYSYVIYDCGFGNAAIFDFEMAPAPGSNCPGYDMLITENLAFMDLDEYQTQYNFIAVRILKEIENNEFPNVQVSTTGQTLIAIYIPNLCVLNCISGATETETECGMECCIRFAVFDNTNGIKMVNVFRAFECGGNAIDCGGGQLEDCKNLDCIHLGS